MAKGIPTPQPVGNYLKEAETRESLYKRLQIDKPQRNQYGN